jgi:hypothetical protein
MHKIISPPSRIVYQKDQWYLYFDPINMKWVKVNEDGKKILSELELHPNSTEAIEHLKKNTRQTKPPSCSSSPTW